MSGRLWGRSKDLRNHRGRKQKREETEKVIEVGDV